MNAPSLHALKTRVAERLSPEMVQNFQRDGAICLRKLLNAGEVALLREGIDANLAAPSPRAKVASRPDDPGRFLKIFATGSTFPSSASSSPKRLWPWSRSA